MDNENIVDLLFEMRDGELYEFKNEEIKKFDEEIAIKRRKMEKYIGKRVNPKSRDTLNRLILDFESSISTLYLEKEKMYYQAGITDCVKFFLSAISFK